MKSPFLRRFGMPSPFFDNEAGFSPTVLLTGSTAFVWYDPSDVANLNWRRNLLTWTEQFDNAVWVKGNSVVTANAAVAPDGTTTADLLYPSTTGSDRRVISASLALSTSAHTVSAYIKAAGKSWAYMLVPQANTINDVVWFDLANGVVGTTGSAATSASIQSVGNGWYRCAVTGLADATSFYSINVADGNGSTSVTANGTDGILIWGAQLELGTTATEYQRITDVNTEVIQRFPTATLYQDAAGTTPVTAPAQPVGLVLDKSQGLVLGPNIATVSSVTGVAIGGPATTSYDISPVMVAGRAYEISFTISGYSGSGTVGLSGNASSYTPVVPFSISSLSGNGTVRVIAISSSSVVPVRLYTQSTNTANFSNISVRELPGFHATQSTAANRPTYGVVPSRGRVNLLTFTEQFDNAAWSKTDATVTANAAVAPDGNSTADRLVETTTANAFHQVWQASSGATSTTHTMSVYAKAAERNGVSVFLADQAGANFAFAQFNLSAGTAGSIQYAGTGYSAGSASIVDVGNGWYRCSVTATRASAYTARGYIEINDGATRQYTGNTSSGILVWGAQLETGSTATNYQRVVSQFDVTDPVGFPSYPLHYLFFGGDLDPRWLQTATITPNADKVQVFAGVRKLSDAAAGMVAELSADLTVNNGTFDLRAPNSTSPSYWFRSKGTNVGNASVSSGYAAPISNVLTGIGDISGDIAALRVNGTQVALSTSDQQTGNYLAYPLYIGRRGGTSLPFNGQLYGLITRFSTANLDASVISQTERWIGGKTGVTI